MLYFCQSGRPEIVCFSSVLVVSFPFPVIKSGNREGRQNLTLGCLASADWSAQGVRHTAQHSHLANLQQVPEPKPSRLCAAKDFATPPR